MSIKIKPFKKNGMGRRNILSVCLLPFLAYSTAADAIITDPSGLDLVTSITGLTDEHCDAALDTNTFLPIFECGDEFFEFTFNAADGGGANVGNGLRYTRLPRADNPEWANQTPPRATGPNAGGCVICHESPVGTSAGTNGLNVVRDPLHSADPGQMIVRNTPHLMGSGALQLLAEEMTERLHKIRDKAVAEACDEEKDVWAQLVTKSVGFGSIHVHVEDDYDSDACAFEIDYSAIMGIDMDLVVKPFQWKGSDVSLRKFANGAFHDEIGMQPVETAGVGIDGDGDGVIDEVHVDDVTSTVVYMAGQTRPHTEIELDELRQALEAELPNQAAIDLLAVLGLPTLTQDDIDSINRGRNEFRKAMCVSCHKPKLVLRDPIFKEPSDNPFFRADADHAMTIDPWTQVSFNLTSDLLDNNIAAGAVDVNLSNLKPNTNSPNPDDAIVELYGDLKRHAMGSCLAENIDEVNTGNDVWMTKELWGVTFHDKTGK